ncbi:MAG: CoA transferase [Desulfobacterales bacterium]|nr:CoA transferase [Desulfobacterales bacterium]
MNVSVDRSAAPPLRGIRVLDLSSVMMGPFAARLMGDMGADVIKVEPPTGDTVRGVGPMGQKGMGPFYMHANRNKRSIVLDIKNPQGKDAMLRLVKASDILLYNVRPQAMERLGLGYEDLRLINPGLIYIGTYGFGQEGLYAKRPAFDDLIQGLSGIPSLVAQSSDGVPRYVPLAVIDRYVGVYSVNAALGALVHKLRTGVGQSIEVPMFEVATEMTLGDHMFGQSYDPPQGPPGYPRSLSPDRHPFATKDGFVCVMAYTDRQWASFFSLIDHPELASDPRFSTMSARTVHSNELNLMLKHALAQQTTARWLEALEKLDIPVTQLHDLYSLPEDPHLRSVGFFQWHDDPTVGRFRDMRPPTRWSETPPEVRCLAPRLGQHSEEVLTQAGYSSDEIEHMARSGATLLDPGKP